MPHKLLIIDDEPGITKAVGLAARQLGFEFRAVHNARDATQRYIEYRPDIVILDMIMPEKDGIDVLNEILLTGIPSKIVLASGYGKSYLRLAQGVANFHQINEILVLQKPFRRDKLVALLEELAVAA